ncbi:MAG: trypsin-like peptidase domain-containing protein [Armatimonadetes bacterium]|nr:trypsin-like peptidase domain-containing protein [Armatimonadota bacterium]
MTKSGIAIATVAVFGVVFAGVTAALRVDKLWRDRSYNESSIFKKPSVTLQPVKLDNTGNAPDFRAAAKLILPSVVNITTQIDGADFFGRHITQDGAGSGVILTDDGYIVTNNHVVRTDMGFGRSRLVDKVLVTLTDGRNLPASVVGTDPRSDLAVIKVNANGLKPIDVGDSAKLEVGQWVIAVGNPLGFENTLSVGVVSNVGRQLPGSGDAVFIDGIQTDAAINPGNSGGALCTADGQLVGINSSIATTTRANIGIGFAIPSNRMRQVVDDIVKFGYAKYGRIGIQLIRRQGVLGVPDAREELKQRTNASSEPPSEGAVVVDVEADSPAGTAGVHELDVVTEVNGKPVKDIEDFQKVVSPLRPGAEVALKLWSAGQVKSVKFTLSDVGKASL